MRNVIPNIGTGRKGKGTKKRRMRERAAARERCTLITIENASDCSRM